MKIHTLTVGRLWLGLFWPNEINLSDSSGIVRLRATRTEAEQRACRSAPAYPSVALAMLSRCDSSGLSSHLQSSLELSSMKDDPSYLFKRAALWFGMYLAKAIRYLDCVQLTHNEKEVVENGLVSPESKLHMTDFGLQSLRTNDTANAVFAKVPCKLTSWTVSHVHAACYAKLKLNNLPYIFCSENFSTWEGNKYLSFARSCCFADASTSIWSGRLLKQQSDRAVCMPCIVDSSYSLANFYHQVNSHPPPKSV